MRIDEHGQDIPAARFKTNAFSNSQQLPICSRVHDDDGRDLQVGRAGTST